MLIPWRVYHRINHIKSLPTHQTQPSLGPTKCRFFNCAGPEGCGPKVQVDTLAPKRAVAIPPGLGLRAKNPQKNGGWEREACCFLGFGNFSRGELLVFEEGMQNDNGYQKKISGLKPSPATITGAP